MSERWREIERVLRTDGGGEGKRVETNKASGLCDEMLHNDD